MTSFLMRLVAVAMLIVGSPASAKDTWVDTLLRVTGLTASPATMRGLVDDVVTGDVWLADTQGNPPLRATTDGDYRSPVFSPTDGGIFVLRYDTLLKIPPTGGRPKPMFVVRRIVKIIGFQSANPNELFVLLDNVDAPLGVVSLVSGQLTRIYFDRTVNGAAEMLAQIRGQDRSYGPLKIRVIARSKRESGGVVESTEVYLQRDGLPPKMVSACNRSRCGEPALSLNGQRIAYVMQAPVSSDQK
jgi:hypothetical protein